jgi:hypothetical protein
MGQVPFGYKLKRIYRILKIRRRGIFGKFRSRSSSSGSKSCYITPWPLPCPILVAAVIPVFILLDPDNRIYASATISITVFSGFF